MASLPFNIFFVEILSGTGGSLTFCVYSILYPFAIQFFSNTGSTFFPSKYSKMCFSTTFCLMFNILQMKATMMVFSIMIGALSSVIICCVSTCIPFGYSLILWMIIPSFCSVGRYSSSAFLSKEQRILQYLEEEFICLFEKSIWYDATPPLIIDGYSL